MAHASPHKHPPQAQSQAHPQVGSWPDFHRLPGGAGGGSSSWWDRGGVRVGVVATAVLLVAVVTVIWLVTRSGSSGGEVGPVDHQSSAAKQEQLLHMLPAGYTKDDCNPVQVSGAVLARFDCGRNRDAGGPPAATYTLMADVQALRAEFGRVLENPDLTLCPGKIKSPGPWHRVATPDQSSGMLVCGRHQGNPTLAWTSEAQLFLGVVRGTSGGAELDQMYAWWSAHS